MTARDQIWPQPATSHAQHGCCLPSDPQPSQRGDERAIERWALVVFRWFALLSLQSLPQAAAGGAAEERAVNCRGFTILLFSPSLRVVAQFGSAFDWGSKGRGFKSRQPD